MSRMFYFECLSGISGDMTVAALLDLGADRAALERMLKSLPEQNFRVEIKRVQKSGLDACDFDVLLDAAHENHDHDMQWLYGKNADTNHCAEHVHTEKEHVHGHSHSHPHEEEQHEHTHAEHVHSDAVHEAHSHAHSAHDGHTHSHRGYQDVLDIIEKADMTDNARALAVRIFTILGEAEAKAHGTDLAHVHFHEVGAIDSIVDILSVAVCADSLGIEKVILPALSEGQGTVRCQHGLMPVPVPAVAAVAEAYGLPLRYTGVRGELVTPTGAAIAACFRGEDRLPDAYRIVRCGIGAGKREYELPGILRIMEIETAADAKDTILKLETDIDDCSGEALSYCMDCLLKAGAREVHYLPIYTKKNRPAYQLQVICTEDLRETLETVIFRETTTIGIRRCRMERTVQERKIRRMDTPWGQVHIKECRFGQQVRRFPEYEDVAAICKRTGEAFPEVFAKIQALASAFEEPEA